MRKNSSYKKMASGAKQFHPDPANSARAAGIFAGKIMRIAARMASGLSNIITNLLIIL